MIQYPAATLQLFPTTTREQNPFEPTFNPKRRIKAWKDPDAQAKADLLGNVTYLFFRKLSDQSWMIVKDAMTVDEALHLNLPGLKRYPPNFVLPTRVTTTSGAPLNPQSICSELDARQIQAQIAAAGLSLQLITDDQMVANWGTETRRLWVLIATDGSSTYNVGDMLFERNQNGVGAPGHWDVSGPEPRWNPDLPTQEPAIDATLGAWDVPVRALNADERIGPTPMIGAPMIQKAPFDDLVQGSSTAAATPAWADQIANIEAMLTKLMIERFGYPKG